MKTALITGASSEIGLSIALVLEKHYNLILVKHEKDIDITEFIKEPIIYTCDFNNEESLKELINKLKNTKIHLLINAAAYDQNDSIENVSLENIIKSLRINTIAPFILTQQLFDRENEGIVINIASTDGIDTYNIYNLPYATSKAALIHITKQLNLYYSNLNIYALCPNYVNTESVKEMDPIFLQEELKRIKQNKLIEVSDVAKKVEDIINALPNEIIIRME